MPHSIDANNLRKRILTDTKRRKRLAALTNYAAVANVDEGRYLNAARRRLKVHGEEHADEPALAALVDKYKIDYLEWCYKRPSLKRKIAKMLAERTDANVAVQMTLFDLPMADGRVGRVGAERRANGIPLQANRPGQLLASKPGKRGV